MARRFITKANIYSQSQYLEMKRQYIPMIITVNMSNTRSKVHTLFFHLMSTYSQILIQHPLYIPICKNPIKKPKAVVSSSDFDKTIPRYIGNCIVVKIARIHFLPKTSGIRVIERPPIISPIQYTVLIRQILSSGTHIRSKLKTQLSRESTLSQSTLYLIGSSVSKESHIVSALQFSSVHS